MGATPTYAFPYQGLTDSPDGPVLGQDLAEAIENKIINVDAAIAALTAAGLTYKLWLGGTRRSTNTAGITNSEILYSTSGAVDLPAASLILVEVTLNFNLSVTGDEFYLRLRETNIGGTVVEEVFTGTKYNAGVPYQLKFEYYYKTSGAETGKIWVTSAVRNSGSGNLVAEATSSVSVHRVGSSSLLPNSNP